MKNKRISLSSEYEVEISGRYSPGYPARGPSYSSGGEPGEPAEMEDISVGVVVAGVTIDITDRLSDKQLAHFEELLLEEVSSQFEAYEAEQVDRAIDEWKERRSSEKS
jgi:hypothetical protein